MTQQTLMHKGSLKRALNSMNLFSHNCSPFFITLPRLFHFWSPCFITTSKISPLHIRAKPWIPKKFNWIFSRKITFNLYMHIYISYINIHMVRTYSFCPDKYIFKIRALNLTQISNLYHNQWLALSDIYKASKQ